MRTVVAFSLLLLFVIPSLKAEEQESIRFYTHSANHALTTNEAGEPVALENMGRRAVDIEVIRWMLNDVGLTNNIRNYPFKRAFRRVQTQDNRALFNVLRTPERDNTVQWVGPLNKYTSYFYEAVDNPSYIQTVNDARSVDSICVLGGNVHHTSLTRLGFENLVLADNYSQCADLLLKGRVTLMPAGENPRFVRRKGFKGKIQRTPVDIASRRGYLALSLNIPEETVNALQESLQKLKSSPDYQQILDTYSEKPID